MLTSWVSECYWEELLRTRSFGSWLFRLVAATTWLTDMFLISRVAESYGSNGAVGRGEGGCG